MRKTLPFSWAALCLFAATTHAQNASKLTSLRYYDTPFYSGNSQHTRIVTKKAPSFDKEEYSISKWSESTVFHRQLKYNHVGRPSNPLSFEVRIGKGGQMYFVEGSFGNCAPNQKRGWDYTPWNDEVWQGFARLDGFIGRGQGHIHQAGPYLIGNDHSAIVPTAPAPASPWFSHIVAESQSSNSYSVVNWASRAHLYDEDRKGVKMIDFVSKILTWNTYTLVGDGILQVDSMFYNYGDTACDITGLYGGIRHSVLPHLRFGKKSTNKLGDLNEKEWLTKIKVRDTAGYAVFSAHSNESVGHGALGIVADKNSDPSATNSQNESQWIYGLLTDASGNFNTVRDQRIFTIQTHGSSTSRNSLKKHETLYMRTYFVFGNSAQSVSDLIQNKKLTSKTLSTKAQPSEANSTFQWLSFYKPKGSRSITIKMTNDSRLSPLKFSQEPFGNNSYPFFYIKKTDGKEVFTFDPNEVTSTPSDGTIADIRLLGFTTKRLRMHVKGEVDVVRGSRYTWSDGTRANTSRTGRLVNTREIYSNFIEVQSINVK